MKSCFLPEVMKRNRRSFFRSILSRGLILPVTTTELTFHVDHRGDRASRLFMGIKIKMSQQFQSVSTVWLEEQCECVGSGMACAGHASSLVLSPVCSTPPWGSWACGPWRCVRRRSSSGTRRSWNASDCDTCHEEVGRKKSDTKWNISTVRILTSKPWFWDEIDWLLIWVTMWPDKGSLIAEYAWFQRHFPCLYEVCVYTRVDRHTHDPFLWLPKEPSKYVKQHDAKTLRRRMWQMPPSVGPPVLQQLTFRAGVIAVFLFPLAFPRSASWWATGEPCIKRRSQAWDISESHSPFQTNVRHMAEGPLIC